MSNVLIAGMQQSMDPRAEQTDAEILRASSTHPELFGIIVSRYSDKILRYIHRRTNASRDDADDILQDIFIKVYRNMNEFDESFAFSSWIYRIAHNTIIDRFRKQKVRPEMTSPPDETFWEHFASEESTDEQIITKELSETMNKALQSLPDKYQDILTLRFYESKSYDEIADILRIPPGTVATNVNRAKKALRKYLEENNHAI